MVCSFLPIWVFTRNVVGNRPGVVVDQLITGSQGPHDYQLSPGDMMKINQADVFIVNGLHLEEFLTQVVKQARPGLLIVEAADAVAPISVDEQGLPVVGAGPAAGSSAARAADNVNPHAFASPRDAARMVMRIEEALARVDPAGAADYLRNAQAYAARLNRLADDFRAVVQAAPNRQAATFHNAFAYLARDSGLTIVGVIETAPDQEPSAGDLAALADKIKATGAAAVFAETQFSPRLAQVLATETGARLGTLDTCETGEQRPDSYERAMGKNLETLREVLGGK